MTDIAAGLADIAAAVPAAEFDVVRGDEVARVPREQLRDLAQAARDAGFEMFIDLCAVDDLRRRPRFDVVVNLVSLRHTRRLRIIAGVPADDPTAPSLVDVYPGANFYEREAFDMFGVTFDGHPDLTRILMPDDWEGHPLRKDQPMGSVPVQFKSSPQAR
jgi:NADH-quinone oxidoreductase subunit C